MPSSWATVGPVALASAVAPAAASGPLATGARAAWPRVPPGPRGVLAATAGCCSVTAPTVGPSRTAARAASAVTPDSSAAQATAAPSRAAAPAAPAATPCSWATPATVGPSAAAPAAPAAPPSVSAMAAPAATKPAAATPAPAAPAATADSSSATAVTAGRPPRRTRDPAPNRRAATAAWPDCWAMAGTAGMSGPAAHRVPGASPASLACPGPTAGPLAPIRRAAGRSGPAPGRGFAWR